jgi:hypothetical protein
VGNGHAGAGKGAEADLEAAIRIPRQKAGESHEASEGGMNPLEKRERNLEIVARIRAQKETLQQIGASYGICRERVRQIGAGHGVYSGVYERLDRAKVAQGIALVERGMIPSHAAHEVGLPQSGFYRHLVVVGIHVPSEIKEPWSDADAAFLRQHYKQPGWSAAKIGKRLGRTRHEVIGKANRLGLCTPHPDTAERVRARREAVMGLFRQGLLGRKISTALGINEYDVYKDIQFMTREHA